MKRIVVLSIFVVFMFVFLIGCGESTKAAWQNDQVNVAFKKGMPAAEVTQKLGQPTTRRSSSNGIQIWEYRKPAEKAGFKNSMMTIGSYGMAKGEDSFFVDILRFWIKNEKVVNIQSEENVIGMSLPGNTGGSIESAFVEKSTPTKKKRRSPHK